MSGKGAGRSEAAIRLVETIKRWDLVRGGDRVLLAVSGGRDSMALLHLLMHLPKPIRPHVTVAHFNHRLRGRASDADEAFVRKMAAAWEMTFDAGRSPPWKDMANLEERARQKRYAYLFRTARKHGCRKILTAHHADDQAETMLIHWVQGAGLRGLSGMALRRQEGGAEILRPMLFLSGDVIGRYVKAHRIPFRKDLSNANPRFLRNRIRRLLKALKKENPKFSEKCSIASLFLKEDQLFINDSLKDWLSRKNRHLKKKFEFSRHLYKKSPASIRYRFWQEACERLGAARRGLDADVVLKLDALARRHESGSHYDLPGGLAVDFGRDTLVLSKKTF